MKKVYCFAINWYLKTFQGLSISELSNKKIFIKTLFSPAIFEQSSTFRKCSLYYKKKKFCINFKKS